MKILHYINQFFAGVGGEESADMGTEVRHGPSGPGNLLARDLPEAEIVTVVCGDNYAAENLEEVTEDVASIATEHDVAAAVCGPAFNAGRYGLVCGELASVLPERYGIPAVTGLYEENAAVSLYSQRALIVRTRKSGAGTREAMETITDLVPVLAAGEQIEDREAAGLFRSNVRRVRLHDETGADRAVAMLLDILDGEEVGTELAMPEFEPVVPPPAVSALDEITVALVTEGGLIPRGNPDGLTTGWSKKWASYPVADVLSTPENFESIHGGYDTKFVNEIPYRLIPADVVADLVEEGRVGELYPRFFTTAGMATPVENARLMGSQIAGVLRNEGVQAVILTST